MVIEGESGREWVLSSIANNAQPLFAFTATGCNPSCAPGLTFN